MARREFARIGTDMPDEATIRALNHDEQWLYDHALYLRPEMTRCGVVPYRPAVWAELATDTTETKVRKWLKGLEKRRLVIVDERYSEVLVRTYVRHDRLLSQPNVVANMVADYRVIASPKIRAAFLAELRRLWNLPDLSDGERGGWQLAMGHYPQPKTEKGQTWPSHIEGATLARLRKSIGPGIAAAMAEHITKGSAEPFTEHSPGGIPKPFDQTPYAGAIAVSTEPRAPSHEHRAPGGTVEPAGKPPSGALTHPAPILELLDRTGPYVRTIRAQLAGHLDQALTDGIPIDTLDAALRDWQTRDRAAPGLLPALIQDQLRRANGTVNGGPASRAAQTLALAQQLDEAANR